MKYLIKLNDIGETSIDLPNLVCTKIGANNAFPYSFKKNNANELNIRVENDGKITKINEPLAFTAHGGIFTIKFYDYYSHQPIAKLSDVAKNAQFSKDKTNWYDADSDEGTILKTINDGETLFMKGNNPKGFYIGKTSSNIHFGFSTQENNEGYVTCSGNVMSLISETATEIPCPNCFTFLFYSCTSLTTAPEVPSTTLTSNCYSSMFYGCTSLTTAPELPSTTLANGCYSNMFYDCTSLTIAPDLPSTTLQKQCYTSMFFNCTSLTTAPELSAKTLTNYCYDTMFYGCTSLSSITCLAESGIGEKNSTNSWVTNVSPNGLFIKSPNATWSSGADGIPNGWTVQDAP